jgi:two-component system sensor histidine kinase BaeS
MVRSFHGDVMRLNRLVEDLCQLSLSDSDALTYRKTDLDLPAVLRDSLENYCAEFARKGIRLAEYLSGKAEVMIFADQERLNQLFANLFENSLRYTAPGGLLSIGIVVGHGRVTVEFQDCAPGVKEKELERLFERLSRVEESRSRTSGGAGLGLAIYKNIVEAHGGNISAHPSPLGGLLIRITFPISEKNA